MKKHLYFLVLCSFYGFAQNKSDSTKTSHLEEVMIISQKYLKNKKNISQKTEVITKKEIEFQNFQNTADLLSNSGNVAVQKSQQGGGSPVLRGFEASRILLLVDGVRMNNLIFRAGHLQNIITVDENMLENTTIFYGSSSTLFGSDALGGAINLETKKPLFSSINKSLFNANLNSRYSSVNEEKSLHVNLNYGLQNFASLTSFSINDFGDLKMGRRQNHNNAFFGERDYYVQTNNVVDELVANNNKFIQKFTAYKQYDFMQKFSFKQKNGLTHDLNFQYSTTTDIPRYDRLTDVSGAGLKNAEWYYGPQKRLLGIYSLNKKKFIFNSDLSLDLSYQNIEESRHNRKFGNYNLQNRIEKVSMFSINSVLKRKFNKSELLYGIETYYDNLNSSAYSKNINSGAIETIDSRYPNGKNNMFRNDLFIHYNESINNKTNWSIGGRIGYTILKSTIKDNSIFELPFDSINQSNLTYGLSTGIIHKTNDEFSLIANLSTGFRVPNIDDLAKVFESSAGSVVVPNENIKPEKTLTADFGFRINSKNKRFEFETNYYYTRLTDAIVKDKFTFNGASEIIYDGVNSQVFASQNKGKAFITGVSFSMKTFIIENLLFTSTFNSTLGRIIDDNKQTPLDHIPPFYGKIGLNYSKNNYSIEAYMLYNGKKNIDDYFLNGEDNEQYAPNGGMPAWETYNFKTSLKVFKKATFYAGVENILDTQYRTFASGMNAPGRNLYGGLKYSL
ncbi:TonB-dependent receptor plug domain-containing protein [Flavobacterium sp.]|uniref:TonB-dependent receptor plug domain-containing protein n=1 Tax=Flavobacterium sp. TaxID=239 RepID=UPI003751E0D7